MALRTGPGPADPGARAVKLAVLMWDFLEEAARDMPHTPASDLFERFLRWTQ